MRRPRHEPGAPDLLLTGGRVLDHEARHGTAIAVSGDRIVAVGHDDEIGALRGSHTRVVPLGGRTVIPGIIDQHLHLDVLGQRVSQRTADLGGPFRSLAELADRIAAHAARRPGDGWVVGAGWSEALVAELAGGGRAGRRELDERLPQRPVVLRHFSGHALLVNGAALRTAGVVAATPDPPGGTIVRDADGEPTGLLLEAAAELVERHVPPPTAAERAQDLVRAMAHLNRLGVTSVTDPRVTPTGLRDYGAVRRSGAQTLRVHCLLYWGESPTTSSSEAVARGLRECGASTGLGDDWLAVLGGKLFADGVPSQRTAWVDEPYPGTDGLRGSLVTDGADDDARVADLHRSILLLHRHRLCVQAHAIGDTACAAVVDGLVRAQQLDPWPDARHVVIHGVLLRPQTVEQLAAHGIGVTTNALIRYHAAAAMRPALGDERWAGTAAVRRLLDAGVRVSDSSDAPVVAPDWRRALQALVTRETAESGGAPVGPQQAIAPDEALRTWTATAAYQQRAEHDKGSIAPGKLADLAILEEDPLAVPADRLHALTPVATLVGGEAVFDRDGLLAGA